MFKKIEMPHSAVAFLIAIVKMFICLCTMTAVSFTAKLHFFTAKQIVSSLLLFHVNKGILLIAA